MPFEARVRGAMKMAINTAPKDFLRVCGLTEVTKELATYVLAADLGTEAPVQFAAGVSSYLMHHGVDTREWTEFTQSLVERGADPFFCCQLRCHKNECKHVLLSEAEDITPLQRCLGVGHHTLDFDLEEVAILD
jgi:hypothetical protein